MRLISNRYFLRIPITYFRHRKLSLASITGQIMDYCCVHDIFGILFRGIVPGNMQPLFETIDELAFAVVVIAHE